MKKVLLLNPLAHISKVYLVVLWFALFGLVSVVSTSKFQAL